MYMFEDSLCRACQDLLTQSIEGQFVYNGSLAYASEVIDQSDWAPHLRIRTA